MVSQGQPMVSQGQPKGYEGQLEGSKGQPEWSEGQPQWFEGLSESLLGGPIEGRTEFFPLLKDFIPYLGCCPIKKES